MKKKRILSNLESFQIRLFKKMNLWFTSCFKIYVHLKSKLIKNYNEESFNNKLNPIF